MLYPALPTARAGKGILGAGNRVAASRSRVWGIQTAAVVCSFCWASGPVCVCVWGDVVTLLMLHTRRQGHERVTCLVPHS